MSCYLILFLSLKIEASSVVMHEQWSNNEKTQINFSFDRKIRLKYFKLENPRRVVIDFSGVKKTDLDSNIPKKDARIIAIRTSQRGKEVRLVIEHSRSISSKVLIKKSAGSTKLIIDLEGKKPPTLMSKSMKIVVKTS